MKPEDKWKANIEKVAFMKCFPGLITNWAATAGKTIEAVRPLKGKEGAAVIIFTDGSFIPTPPLGPEPWELGEALHAARPLVERVHHDAYVHYDRLLAKDKEAVRAARLEKILGAIRNNLDQIPELRERLKQLVQEWK
jgi:diglucosylglycerate octanoyltransferase